MYKHEIHKMFQQGRQLGMISHIIFIVHLHLDLLINDFVYLWMHTLSSVNLDFSSCVHSNLEDMFVEGADDVMLK